VIEYKINKIMGLNTQANWVKMGFVPMCNSSNFDNAILYGAKIST
jgi:hypothetical protein